MASKKLFGHSNCTLAQEIEQTCNWQMKNRNPDTTLSSVPMAALLSSEPGPQYVVLIGEGRVLSGWTPGFNLRLRIHSLPRVICTGILKG